MARSGGALTLSVHPSFAFYYEFGVGMKCNGYWSSLGWMFNRTVKWARPPAFPSIIVESVPAQLDVVEGLPANLDAILHGGASRRGSFTYATPPTADDRAVIDWQRSDDGGASWRDIARSYENEANPLPFSVGVPWRPWSVRHGFIATATDQGALIRVHACYTPSDVPPPPCVFSAPTRINVLQQTALPAIVEAPRSLLVRTGQTASVSATASGLPAPTLQWQTRPANSNEPWADVSTGTGATTINYTTAPLLLADNGTQYRVVATNALGSVESAVVTVSVSDVDVAPTITTQPGSLHVSAGSDAVFAIVATGTEALSYQWRFNGTAIAGANGAVLRLDAVSSANAGSYSVTVRNDAGEVESDEAVLGVSAGTPVTVAPTIVTQPVAVTVNAGNTATFAVGVDGSGPFSFQWRREGVNITGATSAVYTLNSVQLANAGAYSVVVSNSVGAVVSSNALLDVTAAVSGVPPSITTQPATLILPLGGSSIMAVGATGSAPLSYQWYQDGVEIPFATQPVLNFFEIAANFAGTYTVTVTNSVGSRTSTPAQLILLGAPVVTQDPIATTGIEGNTVTFSVAASGSGLRYQWLVNGNSIPGADQASYTTPMLVVANSGAVYSVIVYNSAGLVMSQSAVLTVRVVVAPTVLQQPSDTTVLFGQSAEFCVAFGGTAPFELLFLRWSGVEWVPQGSGHTISDNAPACFLTSTLSLAENGAQFRFIAINAAGEAMTNIATVTVTTPALTMTTLVSAAFNGSPPDFTSGMPSISRDGRLVAFTSQGTNLIAGGTPSGTESGHAYLRDLSTGMTTLINRTPGGGVSSRGVVNLKLASGGRYAVFTSLAGDLVADDTNGSLDVFRRDLLTGTTVRLNVMPNGSEITGAGNGIGDVQLNISGDGRWVTFISAYDVTTDGSPNGGYFLYLRDVQSGITRLVAGSTTTNIAYTAISDDGKWVAYAPGIPAPAPQTLHLHDVEANSTGTIYSFDQSVTPAYLGQGISISSDGRYIAFSMNSAAVLGTAIDQVVVLDRNNPGTPTVASTGSSGPGDSASAFPQLSSDGRYVLFFTNAPNLTGGQAVPSRHFLVVRDLVGLTTTVASRRANGTDVWLASPPDASRHAFAGDGATVAFVSDYADVNGGTFTGAQVFAAPRP